MNHGRNFITLFALIFIFPFPIASFGADKKPKGKGKTVKASVVSDLGGGVGIHARKVPGKFSVPKGSQAVNFKYKFYNSKHELTLTKLSGSNIYSVTEKRPIREAAGDPDFSLPPGKYMFEVGGMPGAYGYLSFRIVPYSKPLDDEELTKDADRVIDVVLWNPAGADVKTRITYYVRDGKVKGRFDQTYDALAINANGAVIEAPRHQGTFTGSISGNVIKGTWNVKFLPQKAAFTNAKGGEHVRMNDGEMTSTTRTVLSPNGTLSETEKASGVTRWKWIGSPPGEGSPQQASDKFDLHVPGKDMPKPNTGTWKDRK